MSKAPSRSLAIVAVTKEDELRIANKAVSHGAAQALTSQFHASLSIPFERTLAANVHFPPCASSKVWFRPIAKFWPAPCARRPAEDFYLFCSSRYRVLPIKRRIVVRWPLAASAEWAS
jgi:hypothetical protein